MELRRAESPWRFPIRFGLRSVASLSVKLRPVSQPEAPPDSITTSASWNLIPVLLRSTRTLFSVTLEKSASSPVCAPSMRQFSMTFFFSLPRSMTPCQSPATGTAKLELKMTGASLVPTAASLPCTTRSAARDSFCLKRTTVPGSMVKVACGAIVTAPSTRISPRQTVSSLTTRSP